MSTGRKNKSGDQPHPVLRPLTMTQVSRLVRLAENAASARGFPMRYDGAGALLSTTDHGMAAGLANLARTVGGLPRQQWRAAVSAHFDQMSPGGEPPEVPEDLDNELYLRLVDASTIDPDWTERVPELVPGVLIAPATHAGRAVALHFDPDALGRPWPELNQIGLANLRRLQDTVEHIQVPGAELTMLGGHMFAASRALVLDTVLRESLHVENPSFGCLVAMPVRDILLIHVLHDPTVIYAFAAMVKLATTFYTESPGPITPHVYYVADNQWHQMTDYTNGTADLKSTAAFSNALKRLEAQTSTSRP
ncbi:hypothetical protein E1263_03075 [Kribbella antibiotica]|uniref:Uncharacterized protein n=1 Tax=Kribbella antibiotica TaxID=190195 RepID=A0A4R4ZUB4_9ACTN|nr:hypothetical protein [Kribbella antibiotica]TDD62713.1 hypothetical protein E1263_03075 [Kribbella antibiotica]